MADIRIGAAESGGSVRLRRGDELVVTLAENPTTGYRWAIETSGDPVISAIGSTFEASGGGGIGAGGQRTLRFRAVTAGQAELRLVLRQEWQPDDVAERFQTRIDVES